MAYENLSKVGLKNAIEWGNQPRTLAWQPLDCEHILACPRIPLERALMLCPSVQRFHDKVVNNAPNECCHQVANIEIEAWYSKASEQAKGIPDIYKLHCSCGRCHVSFCVGGSKNPVTGEITHPRPFWEIR
jgi:hypothetical protein